MTLSGSNLGLTEGTTGSPCCTYFSITWLIYRPIDTRALVKGTPRPVKVFDETLSDSTYSFAVIFFFYFIQFFFSTLYKQHRIHVKDTGTYDNTNIPKWPLRRTIVHLNNTCSNAKSACSTAIESIPLKGASAPNVLQLHLTSELDSQINIFYYKYAHDRKTGKRSMSCQKHTPPFRGRLTYKVYEYT